MRETFSSIYVSMNDVILCNWFTDIAAGLLTVVDDVNKSWYVREAFPEICSSNDVTGQAHMFTGQLRSCGVTRIKCQSPQIINFRYYLSLAGCGYLSIYLSMYRCPFDCSRTIQPRALKFWHNIPHVNNSRRFFQICEKLFFPKLLPFFYISLRLLCNFEEQLHKKKWR